jgi:3D (Asp-Asp-Asp) domain-containing protein
MFLKQLFNGTVLGLSLGIALFLPISSLAPALAAPLTSDEQQALTEWPNWVASQCSSTGTDSTPVSGSVVNQSGTPKNGQSLGGVAGTGFTQAEVDQAKAANSSHPNFSGANDFNVTTYGPPWDSVEGGGTTSTGLPLSGPDNGHGRPRYEIAVDPSVIPYGSLVTVWPNAVNWHGAFLAADTGGAINGHHVDVYDWSGDGTKDSFSRTGGKVEPYTGSLTDPGSTGTTGSDTGSTAACCSSASSVTPGTGAPDGTTFPNLDPSSMASAMDKWMKQQNPNGKMNGLGATIVAGAKHSNVNPFLIVAIGNKESQLGQPGVFNVDKGNNSFGRSAAPGQPSFQGSRAWYKWSSVKASVDYTAAENQGTNVGDMAAFLRNSGSYTTALDSNDLVTFFNTYAPASDGNNTVQYIADVKSWIGQIVSLAGGTVGSTATPSPSTDSSGNSSCCPPSGSGGTTTTPGTADKPDFIDLSGPPVNGTPSHGKLNDINALVIHYTQGNSEGAALAHEFVSQGLGDGVQFNIGKTGKVYQYFPLNNMQETWHVGDINDHAIGIEITGADGEALLNNQAQFDSVVQTAKFLCGYYSIPCGSPKGDITDSTPAEAKGMLGHDEAPNPDNPNARHSDPDTKVTMSGGHETDYNITTGKVWTDADRHDSSTHAYMIKLRTAMGFDPTPGSSGSTPTPTATGSSCPSTGGTGSGGLVWPFATKDSSQYNRIDQGWDIQDKAGANIYAIASGTLHKFNPDTGNFGNDYPTEKLDSSIGGPSDWVYYGHVHILPGLDGQHVNAGQLIAHANTFDGQNGSGAPPGWLEIGFAQPDTDAPTDHCTSINSNCDPTPAGNKMKSLLTGAQPGGH